MSDERIPDVPEIPEAPSPEAAEAAGTSDTPEAAGTSEMREAARAGMTPEELDLFEAFASTESAVTSPNPLGYRSRSERRTYRRAVRRRKSRARSLLVIAPVLVVIAAIVVLLTLLGGTANDTGPVTTLLAPAKVYASGLLAIEDAGGVPVLVLLQAREEGGLVLAMPGPTLLNTPSEGFKTLAELHTAGKSGDLAMALSEAFGVKPAATASVAWPGLRSALAGAGVEDLPGEALAFDDGDNEQIARALLASLGGTGQAVQALWEQISLGGDSSGFRKALAEAAPSIAGGEWVAAVLSGRLVESAGGTYLEPDVDNAMALLEGTVDDLVFTLQVQNGSGVVGIAEQTVELLEPMGYTMLPVCNAEGFPDVEQTRITASPDAAGEARRVRDFLGIGTVSEDQTLEPGHMIVVLGKDYVPPTMITGPTG